MVIKKEDVNIEQDGSCFLVIDKQTNEPIINQFGFVKDDKHKYNCGIPVDEVYRAFNWIEGRRKTKSINKDGGFSYSLKHKVERWYQEARDEYQEGWSSYVSNGALMCAALMERFNLFQDGINGYINIHQNDSE